MLNFVADMYKRNNSGKIIAEYLKKLKNNLIKDFFENQNFETDFLFFTRFCIFEQE